MLQTADSDMSCTVQAVDILRKAKVIVAPAKAAAAGWVMHWLTALTSYKSINALFNCSYKFINMSWSEMIVELSTI